MKDVVKAGRTGAFRIRLENAPPLHGWAVQYVSGMEGEEEIEPGYYLANWQPEPQRGSVVFAFEAELNMVFHDEAYANHVRDSLKKSEIEAEVVWIG